MHTTRLHPNLINQGVIVNMSLPVPYNQQAIIQTANMDSQALCEKLSKAHTTVKKLRIIPRGVRELCAATYSRTLSNFNNTKAYDDWIKLMTLPTVMFNLPAHKVKHMTVCQIIKYNIRNVNNTKIDELIKEHIGGRKCFTGGTSIIRRRYQVCVENINVSELFRSRNGRYGTTIEGQTPSSFQCHTFPT